MLTQETPPGVRSSTGRVLASPAGIAMEILLLVAISTLRFFSATIPIVLLGCLSLWLRRRRWSEIGLARPRVWWRTVLAGLSIALVMTALNAYIVTPWIVRLSGGAVDYSSFRVVQGDLGALIVAVVVSLVYAGLLEEMAFRGHFMDRVSALFRWSPVGWAVAILVSSVCFGLQHVYQGTSGVLSTSLTGAMFAAFYLLARRNLWLPIIVHAAGDVIGVVAVFFGVFPMPL